MSTLPRRCLGCGTKIRSGSRCATCSKTTARGYGSAWAALSRASVEAQPWCTDCGATGTPANPLTGDHLRWPALTLADVEVVCRVCNSKRGPRRDGISGHRRPPMTRQAELSVTDLGVA